MDDNKMPAQDIFERWRSITSARIGLMRSGQGISTRAMLEFQIAFAQARDAVHSRLDTAALADALGSDTIVTHSAVPDRVAYLMDPGLGRRLASDAVIAGDACEAVIVVADGLSATAVQRHAPEIVHALRAHMSDWKIAPIVIAEQARVAIGDDIGSRFGADLVIVLIGERPGLSAADSVGAYLTWAPLVGRSDSERNCVSNIRHPGGLHPQIGAANIAWLADAARSGRLTGIGLKDRFVGPAELESTTPPSIGDDPNAG